VEQITDLTITPPGDKPVPQADNRFQISFDCYLCGVKNTVSVPPIKETCHEDGTITLYYADTVFHCCPDCGQKYAIPNSMAVKTIPKKISD